MAPEVVEGTKGHGREVDWWSCGVLLYEMLSGVPPFRAKSRHALQQQILTARPKFPSFLSPAALSLLKGLLTRDPAKRLGGAAVKAHPFFRGIDWAAVEARKLDTGFRPSVGAGGDESVECFDRMWTEQAAADSPASAPTKAGVEAQRRAREAGKQRRKEAKAAKALAKAAGGGGGAGGGQGCAGGGGGGGATTDGGETADEGASSPPPEQQEQQERRREQEEQQARQRQQDDARGAKAKAAAAAADEDGGGGGGGDGGKDLLRHSEQGGDGGSLADDFEGFTYVAPSFMAMHMAAAAARSAAAASAAAAAAAGPEGAP